MRIFARNDSAAFAVALGLAAVFVVLVGPYVATLPYDFDEAWMMLDARMISRGLRPFVDFPHHEPPLHLYLLAISSKLFGSTPLGFRMLSVLSLAASGVLLFLLVRPFVGSLPALAAEVLLLFSPTHVRAMTAVPETAMVAFTLCGVVLLFTGTRPRSAYAAAVAFVLAILVKPTALVTVLAAAASLACVRTWRRLGHLAVGGAVATAVAVAWMIVASDGVFLEILRFHVVRLGTRNVGMWSIESGFAELRRAAGIDTPWQLAVASLWTFYDYPRVHWPMELLAASALGIPLWAWGCGRPGNGIRVFALLWPLGWLLLDFVAVDFTSPRYFVPFSAVSAFLLAALAWVLVRPLPTAVAPPALTALAVVLAMQLVGTLRTGGEPWYYERAADLGRDPAPLVSFTPMLFVSTGREPACGFSNPALTYGAFGETFLDTSRTRPFRFSDERLVDCLRAHPETRVVIDWAFYFFTRPGSALRAYLHTDGLGQRLFFSPDARDQWRREELILNPFR